jgi:hypothetical protein
MNPILKYLRFLPAACFAVSPAGGAEPPARTPVTIEYYYKLLPGGTKEWLALYKKNHNPILKQLMKEGLLLSERLYERRYHALSPAWDYKITMVWRDWAALDETRQREPEIVRSLYPNREEHDREERRRWEITVEHWDEVLSEVPLD